MLYALLTAGVVAVVILAVTSLGVASTSSRTETETVAATNGVVQETASGTGEVEAGVDEDVDFQASGTLEAVYVKEGEYVKKGTLLAKLNPADAELTLESAEATLAQAENTLTTAEDDESTTEDAGDDPVTSTTSTATSTTSGQLTSPSKVVTVTVTSPSSTPTTSTSSSSSSASSGSSSAGSSTSTDTAATVASDKVQVASDEESVKADEEAVKETRLYAPVSGVIASLSSDSIGTDITASTSSATSSTSDSTSTASTSSAATTSGSLGGSSSSSADSSDFVEIVNTKTLTMTVPFSESDINEIKVGDPATVTMTALSGVELAGTITAISPIGEDDDDVVSYDATITVDQSNAKIKDGMDATADVVYDSASGVTVPTDAVTNDTVEVVKDGKTTTQAVTVGLAGTNREIITSGVSAGEELKVTETLPSLGSATSTTSSSSSSSGSGTAGFGGGAPTGGAGFAAGGFGGGAP